MAENGLFDDDVDAADEGDEGADRSVTPATHRRAANRRHTATAALAAMLCGVIGPGQPMITEQNLRRYLRARRNQEDRDARIFVGFAPGPLDQRTLNNHSRL